MARHSGFALGALLCALTVAVPASAQRGAITEPRNLAELVEQSEVILQGRVTEARVERHPELRNLFTIVITLRVEETLKGRAEQQFTFRQFIWDARDRLDAAGYHKGQQVLLLLNPETRYGLRSPAGLEQGRFRITRDEAGKLRAENGHGNAGLFRELREQLQRKGIVLPGTAARLAAEQRAGPLALHELREMIRFLAGVKP